MNPGSAVPARNMGKFAPLNHTGAVPDIGPDKKTEFIGEPKFKGSPLFPRSPAEDGFRKSSNEFCKN